MVPRLVTRSSLLLPASLKLALRSAGAVWSMTKAIAFLTKTSRPLVICLT